MREKKNDAEEEASEKWTPARRSFPPGSPAPEPSFPYVSLLLLLVVVGIIVGIVVSSVVITLAHHRHNLVCCAGTRSNNSGVGGYCGIGSYTLYSYVDSGVESWECSAEQAR